MVKNSSDWCNYACVKLLVQYNNVVYIIRFYNIDIKSKLIEK